MKDRSDDNDDVLGTWGSSGGVQRLLENEKGGVEYGTSCAACMSPEISSQSQRTWSQRAESWRRVSAFGGKSLATIE